MQNHKLIKTKTQSLFVLFENEIHNFKWTSYIEILQRDNAKVGRSRGYTLWLVQLLRRLTKPEISKALQLLNPKSLQDQYKNQNPKAKISRNFTKTFNTNGTSAGEDFWQSTSGSGQKKLRKQIQKGETDKKGKFS